MHDCKQEIDTLFERIAELEEENILLEEVIRRNTSMFEALLSNGEEGLALTGPDRRIVRVIKGISGFDAGMLVGLSIESLAEEEDRPAILNAYRLLLGGQCGKTRIVMRVPGPDGEIASYMATLTDMLDNPDVQGIVWNYKKTEAGASSRVPVLAGDSSGSYPLRSGVISREQ